MKNDKSDTTPATLATPATNWERLTTEQFQGSGSVGYENFDCKIGYCAKGEMADTN